MKLEKISSIVLNTILAMLILVGGLVASSLFPQSPLRTFVVLSGSMEPKIHTGSLIFVKGTEEYQVGDIVTRKSKDPNTTVTHRIVEKKVTDTESSFILQGDANNVADFETVLQTNIIGKYLFGIPLIGYVVEYAKTKAGIILLLVVPAVIIIYEELKKIGTEIGKKWEYRKRVAKRRENNPEDYEKVDITID